MVNSPDFCGKKNQNKKKKKLLLLVASIEGVYEAKYKMGHLVGTCVGGDCLVNFVAALDFVILKFKRYFVSFYVLY